MSFTLKIHDKKNNIPIDLRKDQGFGVLNIETGEGKHTIESQAIMLILDTSASMADKCRDGRTKIQHAKHTLIKILEVVITYDVEIMICIMEFEETSRIVSNFIKLNEESLEELISKVEDITLGNSTNIGDALQEIKRTFETNLEKREDYVCTQIFMTDGEATSGIRNKDTLVSMVPENISKNIFIGYGIQHDTTLLNALSKSKRNGEYRFIDEIENAGIVYGEILHSIFYKCYKNPIIRTSNCFVYNWNTNEMTNEIELNDIPYDVKRSAYISFNEKDLTNAKVEFYSDNTLIYTYLLSDNANQVNDCSKDGFKLRTMQLLYEAHKIERQNSWGDEPKDITSNAEDGAYIKTKLRAFMKRLNAYIKSNGFESDNELKRLQDDIYIAFTTIGTPLSNMFINARQVSSGNGRAYSTGLNVVMNYSRETQMLPNLLSRNYRGIQHPVTPGKRYYDDTYIQDNISQSYEVGDIIQEKDDPFKMYREQQMNVVQNNHQSLFSGGSNMSNIIRQVSSNL